MPLKVPNITIDPAIQNGHPVISGTRIPVYVLVAALADGASIPEVCEAYDVTEKQIRHALAYASAMLEEQQVVAISP